MAPKLSTKLRYEAIKRAEKGEKIAIICRELGISRALFYRLRKRYEKQGKRYYSLKPKGCLPAGWKQYEKLSPRQRQSLLERSEAGESVTRLCSLYGVSRTLFYRWQERYNEAPQGQKLEALWDQKPKIKRYYKQSSEEYEEAVLSAVKKYPELSSHRLVDVLPQVGNRSILSNHGVFNILRRNNLTTYELRAEYSRIKNRPTFATDFFTPFKAFFAFLEKRQPALKSFLVKSGLISFFAAFTVVIVYGISSLYGLMAVGGFNYSVGIIFSLISLAMGMFFFLYSIKYYITVAIVLSFSRRAEQEEDGTSFWRKILFSSVGQKQKIENLDNLALKGGLQADLSNIKLKRYPFVSIHLATYNEKRVLDRLLTAATSMEYENYEVIIVDDSTDSSRDIIVKWKSHPRVKVVQRESRAGYKGGALKEALKITDKRAEFIAVFDADFIPYPDTITQFLKYFQSIHGTLKKNKLKKSNIAAVQGYQWHVLNKSENWITRGVRSEYAGSYVIERSGVETYNGLKQIAGSVYMIRKDVLSEIGWGTSITEDFELTLRLYNKGYKVVYTPYIQAPAEAVSTVKRLIRQRMRWAEGHSFNVKKMFGKLVFNKKMSFAEKFEFIYISPYYLQAMLFIIGTFCWFMAEAVFRVRLPFWTEIWGWSLVFTNLFALPLMNMVGLFLEEAEERDYVGLFSFIVLSYIVAPFQAYAAVKGFFEKEEGIWFRTPKTGKITDVFTPGKFYRQIYGKIFGAQPKAALTINTDNLYLALATANNNFNSKIKPVKKRIRFLPKVVISLLLAITITINSMAFYLPKANAATVKLEQQINIIDQIYSTSATGYSPTTNSLGLVKWTSGNYSGTVAVYFEAVICNSGYNDGKTTTNQTTYAALYTSAGSVVTNSEVSVTQQGCSYSRQRSSAISLSNGTDYSVKIKSSHQSAIAYIRAARLIVVQSDPTWLTKTETQVEVGYSGSTSTSTYSEFTYPKYYYYDQDKFSPVPTIYFEATLSTNDTGSTAYAALSSDGCSTTVFGSEVSVTGTTWGLARTSSSISLSDNTQYTVCLKRSTAGYGYIANAKIILVQSDASNGISALETTQHFVNAVFASASYGTYSKYLNYYDSANFSGGNFAYYHEGSIRTTGGSADVGCLSTGSGCAYSSTLTTSSTSYVRVRTAAITPATNVLDYESLATSGYTSSSWLIIEVSSLQVPENTWIFIPAALIFPKLISWYKKRHKFATVKAPV